MASGLKDVIASIAQRGLIQTQEALLKTDKKNNSLYIGIPKETSFQEARIALTPLSVALLINNGHKVIIEAGAGDGANFSDKDYSEQGAQISYNKKDIWAADIIVKVAPPCLEEIELMHKGQTLISSLQFGMLKEPVLKALLEKKINGLCFEYLRDEGNVLSVVRAMGEIVGAASIFIAAEYLSSVHDGKGLMLGGFTGVPPTEIVILGAGTVGEYAARTALSLGAEVKVFDSSIFKLRRLQNNLGSRVFTSVMQPIVLEKAITTCDVVIGAIRSEHGRSPCVVTEETVSKMKPFSVVVDVSIDQGGCFETSRVTNHKDPVFIKYGVTHYGVPNIASRVPRTASYALTNIFAPILVDIGEMGGLMNMIWSKPGIREGLYCYRGHLTNKDLANLFNLPYKDLDLLVLSNQ
ncbi:alanine dehydrogenase [Pedobacter montanisoli]|uniref:alanine dehydrogenase n=1 Tax=Pedobacter montanisoli TaxID=2923277 RepID=A0ABS9ZV84_9SPHI|nr:alanine dehydrogenase [Pedobacter montanisoli]MCJ0741758.1 alanine dehydrogenase [Pedobacter montanisoli]